MGDALTALERPTTADWQRILCVAMFVVPVLLAFAATFLARAAGAPVGTGDFQPSTRVTTVCVLGAAAYAAGFMRLLDQVRLRPRSDFSDGLRGSSITVGNVWAMGLGLWAMTAIFVALFMCGPVNRVIGRASVEPWRVWNKEARTGKGCHFSLDVMSRTSLAVARACVTRERWAQIQFDDSVPMQVIAGPLGVQVGLAPGFEGASR